MNRYTALLPINFAPYSLLCSISSAASSCVQLVLKFLSHFLHSVMHGKSIACAHHLGSKHAHIHLFYIKLNNEVTRTFNCCLCLCLESSSSPLRIRAKHGSSCFTFTRLLYTFIYSLSWYLSFSYL